MIWYGAQCDGTLRDKSKCTPKFVVYCFRLILKMVGNRERKTTIGLHNLHNKIVLFEKSKKNPKCQKSFFKYEIYFLRRYFLQRNAYILFD